MSDKFRKSLLSSSLETTPLQPKDSFSHAEELARGSKLKDRVS
jgi:hypothetical protein